ncbi:MAG: hypothetical protein R3250_17130 [Melioribacteraceae bacterium]|nr:hypothetical protein [Melioribacteraceae bacterium]
MECTTGELHILKLNDTEMCLLSDALQFFHECTVKSQEHRQGDEATIKTGIELERMCRTLGIPGYESS